MLAWLILIGILTLVSAEYQVDRYSFVTDILDSPENNTSLEGCDILGLFFYNSLFYQASRIYSVMKCQTQSNVPEIGSVVFDTQRNQRVYRLPNRFWIYSDTSNIEDPSSDQCCERAECLQNCTSLYLHDAYLSLYLFDTLIYEVYLKDNHILDHLLDREWCDTVYRVSSHISLDIPYHIYPMEIEFLNLTPETGSF